MKKLGKEISFETLKNFRGNYGTINYTKPKAIYLNLYSWLTPDSELNWVEKGLRKKFGG